MEVNFLPRQINPTSAYGCYYDYDYNGVESCVDNALSASNYPSCYDYLTDNNCCSSWVGWEYSYLECLNTVYSTCFDFSSYLTDVSVYPCYTDYSYSAPQSVEATTTGSAVPSLDLVAITTGPPTTQPSHSPIPAYTGSGDLLQGYCNTPDYILLDGPTAYWAPVVGCVNEKADCCPYSIAQTGAVTVVSTLTVDVTPGGTTLPTYTGLQAYPVPVSADQATLSRCPADYVTVSGGCCPSGYQLWNEPVGGEVPCYSSLTSTLVPPAVPVGSPTGLTAPTVSSAAATSDIAAPTTTAKPTSAIVNIVYAVKYPVEPGSAGLSTGAKAGIGAGAGVAGIAIIGLSLLLVVRTRKHKKDKQALIAAAPAAGPDSNGQSQTAMSQASPYAYSTRTDLQTDGGQQTVQTPGGFVPQDQNGYFPTQQMQQGLPPQGYYAQQPGQQVPQMQDGQQGYYYPQPGQQMPVTQEGQQQGFHGQQVQQGQQGQGFYGQPVGQDQSTGQYSSPVTTIVSPATGSEGPGSQAGFGQGSVTNYEPSSTASPPPGQQGHGYQAAYEAPGSAAHTTVPSSAGSPPPVEGYNYPMGQNIPANELHQSPPQEMSTQAPPREMGA